MKEARMDVNFRKRLQRHLYYGEKANLDMPSLPLTELAVDYFHDSVPEKLGHVDLYTASNVVRRNRVSPCSMVLSMMYAKRLRQQTQRNKVVLQTMSSADVFFISMMMASKYLYDEGVDEEVFNDEWADNTDQDVDDVNQMEITFLQAMDWKLFVRPHEFEETLAAIERRLALREGLKRGWYTYSEMDILMNTDLMRTLWTQVGSECSKLLTTISAAYLTAVLSVMGSAALAVHISGHLSSMTVAVLSLQSSAEMVTVSSGMPVHVSVPQLSATSAPSLLPYADMPGNASEPDGDGSVMSDVLKSGSHSKDGSKFTNSADEPGSVQRNGPEFADDGNGSGSTNDNYIRFDPYEICAKLSLWSVWFFDSVMSQVWAVTCIRSRLTHCVAWSLSDTFSGLSSSPERISQSHETSRSLFSRRHLHRGRKQFTEIMSQNKDISDTVFRKTNSDDSFARKMNSDGSSARMRNFDDSFARKMNSDGSADAKMNSDDSVARRMAPNDSYARKMASNDLAANKMTFTNCRINRYSAYRKLTMIHQATFKPKTAKATEQECDSSSAQKCALCCHFTDLLSFVCPSDQTCEIPSRYCCSSLPCPVCLKHKYDLLSLNEIKLSNLDRYHTETYPSSLKFFEPGSHKHDSERKHVLIAQSPLTDRLFPATSGSAEVPVLPQTGIGLLRTSICQELQVC